MNWIVLGSLLFSAMAFAKAPSILPDGSYKVECTRIVVEKFDEPGTSQFIIPEIYSSGQKDQLGVTHYSNKRTGIVTYRTLGNTTAITDSYRKDRPYKLKDGTQKIFSSLENSITLTTVQQLENGLFEEKSSSTEVWASKDTDMAEEKGSEPHKYRRVFEVFNGNLEINHTVQNDDQKETASHADIQVSINQDVYTVATYVRSSYRPDPEALPNPQMLNGTILQDRDVCVYTPIK